MRKEILTTILDAASDRHQPLAFRLFPNLLLGCIADNKMQNELSYGIT